LNILYFNILIIAELQIVLSSNWKIWTHGNLTTCFKINQFHWLREMNAPLAVVSIVQIFVRIIW